MEIPGQFSAEIDTPTARISRQRPLEERRAALSPLVAGVGNILFSDALVAEGALVFAKACELGLEGIVSKRAGRLTDQFCGVPIRSKMTGALVEVLLQPTRLRAGSWVAVEMAGRCPLRWTISPP